MPMPGVIPGLAPALWRVCHAAITSGILLFWVGAVGLLLWGRRRYHPLSEIAFAPNAMESLPPLSVLVPACNEADTIERAMHSLLTLDYPDLEIIAVDDRSTDATGAILDRLSASNPRLRVRHIETLPPGWLGKNHALHVASELARGEWLLFTDADVVFAPDTLRRAVAYACQRALDHFVLSPRCETHGFWERVFVSYFSLMFSIRVRPWEVADPKRPAFVGLGAFNMVRASAYRALGGHTALPMDVADDMKLGKVMKRAGLRAEILDGAALISVRWVIGLRGVVDGLTKNAFAAMDYRLGGLAFSLFGLALTGLYPVFALGVPWLPGRILALLTLPAMIWGAHTLKRVSGAGGIYGLAYPLAALVLMYILLRSTWRTYRQRGILWRGTLYPLDELRRNVV